MVECKLTHKKQDIEKLGVLIDTWWNVNMKM